MSRMGFGGPLPVIAAFALLLVSSTARALDAAQPIRIQYSAPAGCPDALEFFGHIHARTDRVRLAEAAELAELVRVTIEQGVTRTVGTLEMPPVGGEPFTRRVEAASCEDVAVALALVVALAHDPDAMTSPVAPPPSSLPTAPPVLPPAPGLPVAESPPAPSFRAAVGVDEMFQNGVAPTLRPIIAPFLELGSSARKIWRPRVVVAVLVEAPEATVQSGPRSATLGFVGGRLAGCPVSAHLGNAVEVDPCLGFELGAIHGAGGSGVVPSHSGNLTWIAVEGLARLRFNAVGTLFLDASGGGGVTLRHGNFVLGPDSVPVYRVPAGFGEFSLGIGVYFL